MLDHVISSCAYYYYYFDVYIFIYLFIYFYIVLIIFVLPAGTMPLDQLVEAASTLCYSRFHPGEELTLLGPQP